MFESIDFTGAAAVGGFTTILILVFRTLWGQSDGWKDLLAAERASLAAAHQEVAEAKEAATAAYAEAHEACIEAHLAREATKDCERDHAITRQRLDELTETHRIQTQQMTSRINQLVDRLVDLGIPLDEES